VKELTFEIRHVLYAKDILSFSTFRYKTMASNYGDDQVIEKIRGSFWEKFMFVMISLYSAWMHRNYSCVKNHIRVYKTCHFQTA
jgi:hypothetical protein